MYSAAVVLFKFLEGIMKRYRTFLAICGLVFLGACGSQRDELGSETKDSPVRYDYTCSYPGSYYWVGVNAGIDAVLQLNWGSVSDRAWLKPMGRGSLNYQGYGQSFPGMIPRNFQVAFTPGFSSVTIYAAENGFWVQKAIMSCSRM